MHETIIEDEKPKETEKNKQLKQWDIHKSYKEYFLSIQEENIDSKEGFHCKSIHIKVMLIQINLLSDGNIFFCGIYS